IICLHGWLDNAASFNRLAPLLLAAHNSPMEIVALDFPGHGLSSHKSVDGPPHSGDTNSSKQEQEGATNENKVTVIGHSMGAGVSVVLAAAFPEWCSSLILLEGGGPLARNAKDCARHVRAACQRR
ncbi:predicted protein, partial [Thalassiosira pseudonana CCMP1335]